MNFCTVVLRPLGMFETGSSVPPEKMHRMAALYKRIGRRLERVNGNAATEGNRFSGLSLYSGGGSLDDSGGGLASTCQDYACFCLMLFAQGTFEGVQVLKPETVEFLSTNQLPRVTGRSDLWCYDCPGMDCCPLGYVCVDYPGLDPTYRAGDFGMTSIGGIV